MKQFIQIALAVFIGVLGAEWARDSWHAYQERVAKEATEKLRAEQDKQRMELMEKIRSEFIKRSGTQQETHPVTPVPEDIQQEQQTAKPVQNKR